MEWFTERRLLACALIAWIVVALVGLVLGPPLGHDEAAFAIGARGDGPAWLYRSAGVTLVAEVGHALGGAEWQLRLPFVALGVTVPLGAFLIGRAACSARIGAWAALVLATGHPMMLRASSVLGDLPAAGCLLIGIGIAIGELRRPDGPRWRLIACAPVLAAAFYFRYGSGPVIGIAALTAVATWWRPIARRPLPVLATAVVFGLALVPHVVQSLDVTGSVMGVLDVSAGMPRRAYLGEGLVTYVTSNPLAYYGALIAPVVIAGLASLLSGSQRRRAIVYLWLVAVGQVVAIGVQSHAQPRYVFVAIAILVVLGVDAIARHARPAWRRAALPLVGVAWLGVAIGVPVHAGRVSSARAPVVAAADAIRLDARGACIVVASSVPQLVWYAGCAELLVRQLDGLGPWPSSPPSYVVSLPRFAVAIDEVLASRPGHAVALTVADPRAQVWRVDGPAPPTP